MKLSLVVLQGKPEGREIPIRITQFLIGRDPQCHLRPASPLISKRHCAIFIRQGKVFLKDFDSTNGTVVNQKPLKGEVQLRHGDEIRVGPLEFRVKLEAAPVPNQPKSGPAAAATNPKATQPAVAALPDTEQVEANSEPTSDSQPATENAHPDDKTIDEDAFVEMLLSQSDEPVGMEEARPTNASDPIPDGSTIMDIKALQDTAKTGVQEESKPDPDAPTEPTPPPPKKEKKPAVAANASTVDAAKAILEKYMRRQR
jgi:predicted component of type VI protein secretion system